MMDYLNEYLEVPEFPQRENRDDETFTPRRMSTERLDRKVDHARTHPGGRTAELMGHIHFQEDQIRRLTSELRELAFRAEDTPSFDLYGKLRKEIEEARELLKDLEAYRGRS